VLPHTLHTVDTFTERDRQDAALLFAGPRAALSGASALRASGVPKIAAPRTLLVLVPPGQRTRSTAWVSVRRTPRRFEVVNWSGPRRVELPRAAADHALTLRNLDAVRALVAEVVSRRGCTVEQLQAELESGPRGGSALLRIALNETGASASAPEAVAARILRRAKLGGFEQNVDIRLPNGTRYVADFLWRELRAILEVDSMEYHLGPADWHATMDRHLELTSAGFSVIHRPPSALKNVNRFVNDVATWLVNRRRELNVA
jgi:very-short-patch-repair endonuclease